MIVKTVFCTLSIWDLCSAKDRLSGNPLNKIENRLNCVEILKNSKKVNYLPNTVKYINNKVKVEETNPCLQIKLFKWWPPLVQEMLICSQFALLMSIVHLLLKTLLWQSSAEGHSSWKRVTFKVQSGRKKERYPWQTFGTHPSVILCVGK